MKNIQGFKRAIKAMHGCDSSHLRSSKVFETINGKIVWDGTVETFRLIDHPAAKQVYAWSYEEDGRVQYVAVLALPPVTSPRDAVQVAIASGKVR